MSEYKYIVEFDLNNKSRLINCNDCPIGKYEDMKNVECCKMFGCETSDISIPKECNIRENKDNFDVDSMTNYLKVKFEIADSKKYNFFGLYLKYDEIEIVKNAIKNINGWIIDDIMYSTHATDIQIKFAKGGNNGI